MLGFEEARALILSQARELPSEQVSLDEALERVLAEPIHASAPLPPFSTSAMDGFALRAEDVRGAGELGLSGESRTGRSSSPLQPSSAQSISTGAAIPEGANAVVPRELVTRTPQGIRVEAQVKPGQHIRLRGEDLEPGDLALEKGARLNAAALGLLASLDRTEILVARRPRVRVLCTGDELRAPGSAPAPAKIPDSVSIALAALAQRAGAKVSTCPYVPDEREATIDAVGDALDGADLLLTVGGVSVGDHDWIKPALERQGIELTFWKVAIKPGKPIAFGKRVGADGPLVLGLPGNPASALVTFCLFGVPLLRALQGDSSPDPRTFRLPLARRLTHKAGRLEFVRAQIRREQGDLSVVPFDNQASGALTSLAWADALILFPADTEVLEAGELVEVLYLQIL